MNCKDCNSYVKFSGHPFCFLKNRVLDNMEMELSDCLNKHIQKEHFSESKLYSVTKRSSLLWDRNDARIKTYK